LAETQQDSLTALGRRILENPNPASMRTGPPLEPELPRSPAPVDQELAASSSIGVPEGARIAESMFESPLSSKLVSNADQITIPEQHVPDAIRYLTDRPGGLDALRARLGIK
jgi:hypothetical protein